MPAELIPPAAGPAALIPSAPPPPPGAADPVPAVPVPGVPDPPVQAAPRPPAPIVTPGAPPGPIDQLDFVVVDVETTGWLPAEAAITDIGAVRFSNGHVLAHFSALVNPGSEIPAEISALTGITDAMAQRAPGIQTVLPRFLAFAEGSVLAAHHAAFDIGFLRAATTACGLDWPDFAVLDTVPLARMILGAGEVPDCKLATLAGFFHARTMPCHRALPDALATVEVLQGLLGRLAVAGLRTLAELADGQAELADGQAELADGQAEPPSGRADSAGG
ncbi:MAG: exonuclease domain-containing protein [Actinomycetota bacterium]